jgi:hypothetical protein
MFRIPDQRRRVVRCSESSRRTEPNRRDVSKRSRAGLLFVDSEQMFMTGPPMLDIEEALMMILAVHQTPTLTASGTRKLFDA